MLTTTARIAVARTAKVTQTSARTATTVTEAATTTAEATTTSARTATVLYPYNNCEDVYSIEMCISY